MDMMKQNCVQNGGIRIPIGFRFRPTDEELIVHYLNRKVRSLPLPAAVIPELDDFQSNPLDLPGDSKEKRYFFRKRNRNVDEKCNRISTGSGYWKSIGNEKYVMASARRNQTAAIGVRKTLVFYQGKHPHGLRTHWVMHQFRLVDSVTTTPSTHQKWMMEMEEEWVVCCIYQKKMKSKRSTGGKIGNMTRRNMGMMIRPGNMDIITMEDHTESGPPPPPQPSSSSSSSEITEISSKGSDHEEEIISKCPHYN